MNVDNEIRVFEFMLLYIGIVYLICLICISFEFVINVKMIWNIINDFFFEKC